MGAGEDRSGKDSRAEGGLGELLCTPQGASLAVQGWLTAKDRGHSGVLDEGQRGEGLRGRPLEAGGAHPAPPAPPLQPEAEPLLVGKPGTRAAAPHSELRAAGPAGLAPLAGLVSKVGPQLSTSPDRVSLFKWLGEKTKDE